MTDASQFTEMEWIKFLGIEPVSAAEGEAVIRLCPQPVHLNHNGTVNAAVLYGLAEVADAGALVAGMLEEAAASYTVIRRATVEYEAPARGDVTASGSVSADLFSHALGQVRTGRPIEVEVPVAIADSAGNRVCSAQFTVAIRPRRKDHPMPANP
jgi:acyl-coenzyme A thioesterase PaaI-like protein